MPALSWKEVAAIFRGSVGGSCPVAFYTSLRTPGGSELTPLSGVGWRLWQLLSWTFSIAEKQAGRGLNSAGASSTSQVPAGGSGAQGRWPLEAAGESAMVSAQSPEVDPTLSLSAPGKHWDALGACDELGVACSESCDLNTPLSWKLQKAHP